MTDDHPHPSANASAQRYVFVYGTLRRGGLIAPVLILPLSIPILIFGATAAAGAGPGTERSALLFVTAISLVALVVTPFAAALALRLAED